MRAQHSLRFTDYDGLRLELEVAPKANPPLAALHPAIPAEHAVVDLVGARAYGIGEVPPGGLLTDTLGFTPVGDREFRLQGERRSFEWSRDEPPAERGIQGAGSVHHIAWASHDDDHLLWQERVRQAGSVVTDVRDRDYFKSIYFREPQGVLFEIATLSPGFAVDEDPGHLGEALKLPAMHEHLRAQLERILVPIVNPRERRGEETMA
jgi:glyoxalase family protein